MDIIMDLVINHTFVRFSPQVILNGTNMTTRKACEPQ